MSIWATKSIFNCTSDRDSALLSVLTNADFSIFEALLLILSIIFSANRLYFKEFQATSGIVAPSKVVSFINNSSFSWNLQGCSILATLFANKSLHISFNLSMMLFVIPSVSTAVVAISDIAVAGISIGFSSFNKFIISC